MFWTDRVPCCEDNEKPLSCGTRYAALVTWVCHVSGKQVRTVSLGQGMQGKSPFFAQPVAFDGRQFLIAFDHGCDTEKLLHEFCHWYLAPKSRRNRINFGLGPGPSGVPTPESDNEEVAVMLLERKLAPYFLLDESRIARPDYNVAHRKNIDWDACEQRAEFAYALLQKSLA